MTLIDFGVSLRFDSVKQTIKCIELYDLDRLCLFYHNLEFNGSSQVPTLRKISKLFGPTFPGNLDEGLLLYKLKYPGIEFWFKIPEMHLSLYENQMELAVDFPDGTSPICFKILIYNQAGGNLKEAQEIWQTPILDYLPFYFQHVQIDTNLKSVWFSEQNVSLTFKSTIQDVITEIGSPSSIFFKEDDKLQIHDFGNSSKQSSNDYFYNYFYLGLDILFDGTTHEILKFIVHTNFPNHYEFNRYNRCNFSIKNPKSNSETFLENNEINLGSKFEAIKDVFGKVEEMPIILNRGANANPFGSTKFYGFDEIIFEVMKNGHIGMVIFYR